MRQHGSVSTALVRSVHLGRPREAAWAGGTTAIDKQPATGPVAVGELGLEGDQVADTRHHGGPDQAVYAFAREELDHWERVLGGPVPDGLFGENLTTVGLPVDDAELGERWRVGPEVVLEVSSVRTPCRTFQAWIGRQGLDERGWVRRFSDHGRVGAYLRVLVPGSLSPGDPVEVVHRPGHGVTVAKAWRAVSTEPSLLPDLLAVERLVPEMARTVHRHAARGSATDA